MYHDWIISLRSYPVNPIHRTQLYRLIFGVEHNIDHGANLWRQDVGCRIKKDSFVQLALKCSKCPKNIDLLGNLIHLKLLNSEEKKTDLWMLDSIMSAAMAFSLWLRWLANSGSGQWRSRTKFCKASNFQKMSSEVAHPLLKCTVNVTRCIQMSWVDKSRKAFIL